MHVGRGDASGQPVDIVELGATARSAVPEEPLQNVAADLHDKRRGRLRRRKSADLSAAPSNDR
jgi:hypothetical protein